MSAFGEAGVGRVSGVWLAAAAERILRCDSIGFASFGGTMKLSLTTSVIVALIAGLVVGAAISALHNPSVTAAVGWFELLGQLWVNALRMTVVPLVVALLIGGVASVADVSTVGRLGWRTGVIYLALLAMSAVIALLLAPPLFAITGIDAAATSDLSSRATLPDAARHLPGFRDWIMSLIPTNPIQAAAESAMLPLVIFSILFALAIMRSGTRARETLLTFFQAIGEAMLTLVQWVIKISPIGVFALTVALATRLGASVAGVLGLYVVIISGLYLLCTILLYPIVMLAGHVSLRRFVKAMSPAQVVALSTRSSLASLPALLEGADKRLMLAPAVSGFVLPLSVAVFKASTPITQVCSALLVSRLYGVPLSATQLITVGVLSIFLSFGSPGIPSGGILVLAPVLASVGLPPEGLAIVMAVDLVPDAARTLMNVTADAVVVSVVADHGGPMHSQSMRVVAA